MSKKSKTGFVFLNRDLSWLNFNYQVLKEAADESVPLFNRIQFLSIFSSNLDEFFRVRMPSIYAFTRINSIKASLRNEYPENLALQVKSLVLAQSKEFGQILTEQVLPSLKSNGIHLYYDETLQKNHIEVAREYFLSQVLSFLQPVILKKENKHNVFLENNHLYFIILIESLTAPGNNDHALLNIPSDVLPRFFEINKPGNKNHVIFIDDIVRENLYEVFPGFNIHGTYSVKLTRDADLNIEDEYSGDISEKIEKHLSQREIGAATRLLFDGTMPANTRAFVKEYFSLTDDEMVAGGRYHNLKDMAGLSNPTNLPLTYPNWPPAPNKAFSNQVSIFKTIREGERLLHLPYQSYNYILRFFNEAAIDPDVQEIYITLYRIAANSHIANALVSAARNGKKVTVFVELKARFDEANNLKWAKKMKAAGITIINSIPGLKVHAKIALIRRLEKDKSQFYSLLATGNFNESTAKYYADHVFFSCNINPGSQDLANDLQQLFTYLQSRLQPRQFGNITFKQLLVSQFNMIKRFSKMIDREMENARAGLPAQIIIKVNNLQDREMIGKLYQANNAGVTIELIARGICCLAPGIENQSEHITVRRIVDRYLEHARVFIFHNNGNPEVYMGSADWMTRNLHSRIEVIFPVTAENLKQELMEIIQLQLADTKKAVVLRADYSNEKILAPNGSIPVASQQAIYEYVKDLNS